MGKQKLVQKIDLLKTTICQKEMRINTLESKIELDNRKKVFGQNYQTNRMKSNLTIIISTIIVYYKH